MRLACIRINTHISRLIHSHFQCCGGLRCVTGDEWTIMCDYWNELFTPAPPPMYVCLPLVGTSKEIEWLYRTSLLDWVTHHHLWRSPASTATWKFDFTSARDCHQKLFKFAFNGKALFDELLFLSWAVTVNSIWINIFFKTIEKWVKINQQQHQSDGVKKPDTQSQKGEL